MDALQWKQLSRFQALDFAKICFNISHVGLHVNERRLRSFYSMGMQLSLYAYFTPQYICSL